MNDDNRDQLRKILEEALDDEYKARATYAKVIETFGSVRPFVNIINAEIRHAEALIRQFARLGFQPPKDKWAGNMEAPVSLLAACKAGIDSEIENAQMYDRFLDSVNDDTVRNVLLKLKDASQNNHLPAFKRCFMRLSTQDK